jgi:hypothetical protein
MNKLPRWSRILIISVITVILLCHPAWTSETKPPIMEALFGPTPTNAVIGNGGLSAGLSRYGELVVFKWPSPSYYDHLTYRSRTPAFKNLENYDRQLQAGERAGAFAGIRYKTSKGEQVSWLRSAEWSQQQTYAADDAPIVITTYRSANLGLTVTGTDFVKPNSDVLIRNYSIKVDRPQNISPIRLVYLANLAPCNTNPNFKPDTDWEDDSKNGFATVYSSKRSAFVSFRPHDRVAKSNSLPNSASDSVGIDGFIDKMDTIFPAQKQAGATLLSTKDIYLSLGADRKPAAQYLFADSGKPADLPRPFIPNKTLIVKGPALTGLEYDFDKSSNSVSVYLTAANRSTQSLKQLENARQKNFITHLAETKKHWSLRMKSAILPTTNDRKIGKVLKRGLVNLLLTIDRESGMIAGSINNQPSYGLDWTRDGALYNYVLNLAGFYKEAQKHGLFHARIQRKKDGEQCSTAWNNGICYAGSWSQCYYADGRPAWVYDFEIDQVGYGIWSMWLNAVFMSGSEKQNYLRQVFPAIQKSADLLVKLRDPFSALQSRAQEDDLPWLAQTQYGAATTLMGLKSAVAAGQAIGTDPKQIKRWQDRINELSKAIDTYFWNAANKTWDIGIFGVNGGILMWPAQHMLPTDPRVVKHSNDVFGAMQPFFLKANDAMGKEWWYVAKGLAGLSVYWHDKPEKQSQLEKNVQVLLKEVPTPDTLIYGESLLVRDKPKGGRFYDMRVGQPHNTSASYSYVVARLFYGPQPPKLIPFGTGVNKSNP